MLIGFVSAKGSPGVTTSVLAVAAAWPRTAIVIDADPAGGDIAAGLGRAGWPPGHHLLELAARSRTATVETALRGLVVRAAGHAPLALAGLGNPVQSATVPWRQLADGLTTIGDADVLCDLGRYIHGDASVELMQACAHIVVVTGSSLPMVRATVRLVEDAPPLRSHPSLTLLVVDPGRPYRSADIAGGCGIDRVVELPHDPRTAGVWSHGAPAGRHLERTVLHRAARRAADKLAV